MATGRYIIEVVDAFGPCDYAYHDDLSEAIAEAKQIDLALWPVVVDADEYREVWRPHSVVS